MGKWGVAILLVVVVGVVGMRFARWRWWGERVDRVVVATVDGVGLAVCDRYGEAAVTLYELRAGRFVDWGGGEALRERCGSGKSGE